MPRLIRFLLLWSLATTVRSVLPAGETSSAGRIDWARLQTSGPFWNRHGRSDPEMLAYLRKNTPLNIDSEWHFARADSLEGLRSYPFIYTENIEPLSPTEAHNLAEYLRRGGFLFIDACANPEVNPDIPRFLAAQLGVLAKEFPDLRTESLPPQHEIFSINFKMKEFPPYVKKDGAQPLHAVYAGRRIVAIIALTGMQCSWAGQINPEHATACAQMVINIYLYAMTH
jgi:hypothetical protein